MSAQRSTRHPTVLILLVALMALVVVACSSVGSGGTLTPRSPDTGTIAPVSPEPSAEPSAPAPSEPPAESEAPTTPEPTEPPTGATSVRIYLFMDGKLVPVRREVDATRAVGRAALNALFEGPTAEESAASPALTTDVPEGTILLGLDIADGAGHGRPLARVRTRPDLGAGVWSPGPGHLHADPVPDGQAGCVQDRRRTGHDLGGRGSGRRCGVVGPRGLARTRSCRRSSWSGRRGARPSATLSG